MKLSGLGYLFKPCIISYRRPDGRKCGKSEAVADGKLRAGYKRKKSKAAKWYGCFKDENGRKQRVPLAADKSAAGDLLHGKIEDAKKAKREGADPFVKPAKTPLAEHVAAYSAYLSAQNRTAGHVAKTVNQINAAIAGCRFAFIGDITSDGLEEWLAERRKAGLSICSSNHYLTSMKRFTTWLAHPSRERARKDALRGLKRLNADADRRHERRAVSADEFNKLISTTLESDTLFRGLDGKSRATLYAVAAATGLRVSELASVTPGSFSLDTTPATLTVAAGYSKNRKRSVQPLTPALVPHLRGFLADREADVRVWPGTWTERASRMIRKDLAAAGIAYKEADRTFDFHALRGQFITSLGRAGVPLVTAQKLARHSDPKLTANVYTHLAMIDLAGAVENLPVPNLLLGMSVCPPLAPHPCRAVPRPAHAQREFALQTA